MRYGIHDRMALRMLRVERNAGSATRRRIAQPNGEVDGPLYPAQGDAVSTTANFSGGGGDTGVSSQAMDPSLTGGENLGTYGLDPELIADLEKQFGFDKPVHVRFLTMVWNYVRFDFGESYFQDRPVIDLIIERMPVSISLGLWSLLLIILFAGGNYFDIFPLRGLTSENFDELSFFGKIGDYFWHLAMPLTALTVGGFATLSMLTKNSFLEEINKQFVLTARAKGLTERRVLYGHVFRNAMLIVIAGFPSAFVGIFFYGSVLIEVIFSLEGMGLLSYDALIKRDYPILFGTLFMFGLVGLVMHIIGDLTYVLVDPRIDFESR